MGGFCMNSIEEDFKIIEEFEEEIKFYVNSDLRLEILKNLFTTPSTLKLLHKNTGLNYTSVSTNVAKLESNKIIDKKKDFYYLKNQAKFKLLNVLLLENNLEMLSQLENFLNNHIVKNDNLELLSVLPYIGNLDLVQATNINPDIAIELIEENMLSKGAVKSVCIYLHPNFDEMLEYMMERSSDFEAVVPLSVAKNMLSYAMNYKIESKLQNKVFNIKPLPDNSLNMLLVVSHDKVVMGLRWFTGKFNKNCVLVSHEQVVIDWAYNLYTEYDKMGRKSISIKELIEKNNNLLNEGII